MAIAVAALAVGAHGQGRDMLAARLFGLADWVASKHRVATWPPPEEHDYAAQVAATRTASAARISPMPPWPVNHSRSRMPSPGSQRILKSPPEGSSVVDAPSRHHTRVEGVLHLPHLGHGVGHLDEGSGRRGR